MTKKVVLPLHTGQEAEFYGKTKLKKMGIKESHPKYKELLNKYVQNFAHQSYKSMSANFHDLTDFEGDNPTTGKINKKVFDIMKGMYGKSGFFADAKTREDSIQLERLFRSSITTLVKILLKVRSNIVLKAKEGRPSDLSFSPDSTKADNLQVIMNQYIQAYLACIMTAQLEPIFDAKAWNIEEIIKKLGNEKLNKAIDPNTPKEVRYDILHNDESRILFAKAVYDGFKKGMVEPCHRTVAEQRNAEKEMAVEDKIDTLKGLMVDLVQDYALEKTDLEDLMKKSKNYLSQANLPSLDPLNFVNYVHQDLGLETSYFNEAKNRLQKQIKINPAPKNSSGYLEGLGQLVKADKIGTSKAKVFVKIENPYKKGKIIVSGILPISKVSKMFIGEIIVIELDPINGKHGLKNVKKIK